ncbi:MAG: hypothetical protein KME09_21500 [Pleurocapsa minor HA4230-MV1]|jgi:hypothetical protein|nr:hypothetical protein [Pleurocapsa minor HA4230-MV1]
MAYPQFKRYSDHKELHELYTPTIEEIKFVTSRTIRKTGLLGLMNFLAKMKSLQTMTLWNKKSD